MVKKQLSRMIWDYGLYYFHNLKSLELTERKVKIMQREREREREISLFSRKTKGGKSYLSYSHPLKTSERRLNANNLMEVLYG